MEGLNFQSYVTLSGAKCFCQRQFHRTGEKVTALANLQKQYGVYEICLTFRRGIPFTAKDLIAKAENTSVT